MTTKPNETIEHAIAVLSEMKHHLDRYGVSQTYVRGAIIATSANLSGDWHEYVCEKVLGIPMGETPPEAAGYDAGEIQCARCNKVRALGEDGLCRDCRDDEADERGY